MGKNLILIFILCLATFLRVWQLDKVPIELFGDEIDAGYQAYSILKTGKDYFGNNFPILFQSFDEYRLPVLIYSNVPFIAFFGLNEWGTRLSSVLLGLLSILGLFLLTKKLFNEKIALIATLLLAISPWHISYSRWSNDAIGFLTIILFSTWLFLVGLKKFNILILSIILFAFSVYSYSIATVVLPLFLILLFLIYKKELLKIGYRKVVLLIILGGLIITPYLILSFKGSTAERFSKISVFTDETLLDKSITSQSLTDNPFKKIFRNKYSIIGLEIIKNYTESFSSQYLFTRGDPNFRHSVAEMGQQYIFEIVLLILGFIMIIKNKLDRNKIFILGWLLIAPIAAALTKDGGNHSARLISMIPALTIIGSLGFYQMLAIKKFKKLLVSVIVILAVFNFTNYLYRYYIEWSKDSFRFWQYGYKESFKYIKDNDSKYSRIFFNNTYEPALPRFLFWYQYDPALFQKQFSGKSITKDLLLGFDGFKLGDKYYFGRATKQIDDQGIAEVLSENDLYLVSQRDEVGTQDWSKTSPSHLIILKTIKDPNGQPIFYIASKKSKP